MKEKSTNLREKQLEHVESMRRDVEGLDWTGGEGEAWREQFERNLARMGWWIERCPTK